MSELTKDPLHTVAPEIVVGAAADRAPAPIAQPAAETNPGRPDDILTEKFAQAIVRSIERPGRWYPANEIHVRAIAGDVEITFPDDAEVEVKAKPLAESVEQRGRSRSPGECICPAVAGEASSSHPEKPLIHVEGRALFDTLRVNGRES